MDKPIKSRKIIFFNFILWFLAVCAMLFVFFKKLTPSYSQETLHAVNFITTPDLYSEDVISQTFTSTYDNLSSIDIALSYEDNISQNACVRIQLLHGEDIIMEQDLAVRACPNQSFLSLQTNVSDCQDEEFIIRVENISPAVDHTAFALMATNKEYLYLTNTSDCVLNGISDPLRMICRFTYQTGYIYFPALTYVFWILIATLILSKYLSQKCSGFRL